MAAVAEGDGAGDRFREVEQQQDAVGIGGGFAAAGAEAMKLQGTAGSTVHVDVGKKLDLDLLSEPVGAARCGGVADGAPRADSRWPRPAGRRRAGPVRGCGVLAGRRLCVSDGRWAGTG